MGNPANFFAASLSPKNQNSTDKTVTTAAPVAPWIPKDERSPPLV